MRRSPLSTLLTALGLSLLLAGSVHAGVGADNESAKPNKLVGYYEWRDQYQGGEQSLPYGLIEARTVLEWADGLAVTSLAIAQLEARGYVRRPADDVAGTQVGFSFVALAFEKPGYDVNERQPLLVITTRAVEVEGIGYRPATKIYAAMFRDSAETLVIDTSPADSAIAFIGTLSGGSSALKRGMQAALGGGQPHQNFDPVCDIHHYSVWEEPHGTWQYQNSTSPGMQQLMSQAYQQTALGAANGAALGAYNGAIRGGMAGGIAGALIGGYTQGLVAWHRFWLNPPDTSRVIIKQ